jgi:hypothetical protein
VTDVDRRHAKHILGNGAGGGRASSAFSLSCPPSLSPSYAPGVFLWTLCDLLGRVELCMSQNWNVTSVVSS